MFPLVMAYLMSAARASCGVVGVLPRRWPAHL